MVAMLSNPDFWLGAAMGAVFLVMMITGCCWVMHLMDKTKATRALAGAVDGRGKPSDRLYHTRYIVRKGD